MQSRLRTCWSVVFVSIAAAVFAGTCTAARADGLIANWTMNDPVGSTTVQDESGNGHTATLPTGAGAATLGVPAVIGTGVSLPGNSNGDTYFISVPGSSWRRLHQLYHAARGSSFLRCRASNSSST